MGRILQQLETQVRQLQVQAGHDAAARDELLERVKGFEEKARQDAADKKRLEDQVKGFEEKARQDAADKKRLEEKNGDLQKEVETAKGCMIKVAEKMQVFVNIIIPKYYRLNIISQMFRQVATVSLNSCREETKIRALRNLR